MKRLLAIGILLASAIAAWSQNYETVISWTAPAVTTGVTVTGYTVSRSIHAANTYTVLTATPITAPTYTDTTVLNGTSYDYTIASANTITGVTGTVYSAPSPVLTLAIPSVVAPSPGAPTGNIVGQEIALTLDTKTGTAVATVKTDIEGPFKATIVKKETVK